MAWACGVAVSPKAGGNDPPSSPLQKKPSELSLGARLRAQIRLLVPSISGTEIQLETTEGALIRGHEANIHFAEPIDAKQYNPLMEGSQ